MYKKNRINIISWEYINMITLNIFICIILICASIQDLKSCMVYDRFFIALYACLLFHNVINIHLFLIAIFFFLLFVFFYKKEMLGGADIKLYMFILLKYGFHFFTYCLILSNTIGLLLCLCTKKKRIPFIPCITLGILFAFLLL